MTPQDNNFYIYIAPMPSATPGYTGSTYCFTAHIALLQIYSNMMQYPLLAAFPLPVVVSYGIRFQI
jgi:hypothetical protein